MKRTAMFTLLILLALVLLTSACSLPARGTPPPTPTHTAVISGGVTPTDSGIAAGPGAAPTNTPPGPLPTPVVVTATPIAPAPLPATPAPATATPLPVATRLQFVAGETTSTVDGEINAGQSLYYVVQGTAGQTLSVDVWSPNGDVYLSISGVSNGQVLLDSALHDTMWTGLLPVDQDYYISVVAGGGRSSYAITVEVESPVGMITSTPPSTGLFDPYAVYGNPSMEDPMNGGNLLDWTDSEGELPDTDYIRMTLDGARMYVTGHLVGFSTWWFSWRDLSDAYIEATFDSGNCSGQDAYGLIIRGPEHMAGVSYGYVVAFSCDGQYWVFRLDGADPFTAVDLVSWTPSEYIHAGSNQRNTLGIEAIGDTLTIYANGQQIAEVTDAHYDFGRYGLFVSPALTADYTYRIIRLAYWDLSE